MVVMDYSYLYEKYSEYISAEQLYQICHIAKRKAKWLLDNGVIPCHNSGKKTRCYRIRLEDVINYLQECEHDSEAVIAPVGTFCSYQRVSPIAQIDRTEYERYYGLRRSEVLGLRWSAIDMKHKTISISHKVIEAEVDGKFVPKGEDVLKTKSSFRTLPLIPAVENLLLEEKEKQEMYRRLFKKSYCRDYLDYICVDQCGKLLRPNYVTEHFSWIIEKYGLRKVRFHDLRHTCASLLLSNGISMKQIQIWLGHSTFSTTADIYAHLDYSAQEASANTMNGLFVKTGKNV